MTTCMNLQLYPSPVYVYAYTSSTFNIIGGLRRLIISKLVAVIFALSAVHLSTHTHTHAHTPAWRDSFPPIFC